MADCPPFVTIGWGAAQGGTCGVTNASVKCPEGDHDQAGRDVMYVGGVRFPPDPLRHRWGAANQ